jgi:tetratricopeptide (TPR) repeat protein
VGETLSSDPGDAAAVATQGGGVDSIAALGDGSSPAHVATGDAEFMRSLQGAVTAATRGELAFSDELARVAERRALDLGDTNAALEVAVLPGLWSLWATGDAAAAVEMVERAVARQPVTDLEPPYPVDLVLAAFFADAGQTARAQAFMSRYLSAAGPFRPGGSLELPANFYAARGAIALAGGRHAEAIQVLTTGADAAEETPVSLAPRFRLALALERVGESDSAIAVYKQVVEEAKGSSARADAWAFPYALTGLADLYETIGDPETAAVYFRQFVELWRDADPELQAEVEEVRSRSSTR